MYTIISGAFSVCVTAGICFAIIAALAIFTLFTSGKASAVFLTVTGILCCLNTFFGFCADEKQALQFIEKYKSRQETVFEGEILSAKNYTSYSQADIVITLIDGKAPKFPYKCRIGYYSGENLVDGDSIVFKGTPQYPVNDESESFDTVSYLRSRRIFAVFDSADIVSSHARDRLSFTGKIRAYAEKVIYRFLPPETGDIAYSMISGDKGFLDKSAKDTFTKSGIIHILCVSGMHFSILMGALYSFLKLLGIRKQFKLLLMMCFCLFYLAVTGFPVSAVRAAVICIISYCASILGRSTDGYSSLFAAMVFICLLSPGSVLDISAQLSFFATFGIITLTDSFAIAPKKRSFLSKISASAANLLLSNIGAVIFTFAVSSISFGGISITGIFATAAVSFACEVLLIGLLILIILSPIPFILPLQHLIAFICNEFTSFIIKCADFFASFRFSYIDADFPVIALFLFLTAVVFCVFFIYLNFKRAVITSVFCILMLCCTVTVLSLAGTVVRDSRYCVSYFRQNQNDRQLSVRLGSQGYLIVNADSELCVNPSKADFDTVHGRNYLLLIPDSTSLSPAVLAENVSNFDSLYGIKRVFVPNLPQSEIIVKALNEAGIEACTVASHLDFGSFELYLDFSQGSTFIGADDGRTRCEVLFSDSYSPSYFSEKCDIAAYFTRKTENQFDIEKDTLPPCDVFFTRLKKGQTYDKIHNTYGEKSFYIKE